MPDAPTLETFSPALGDRFAVGGEDGATVELTLVEAAPRDAGPHAPRPPFSLLFEGPSEPLLPQATYRFQHPAIGVLDIFIVPLGRDDYSATYEAFFA